MALLDSYRNHGVITQTPQDSPEQRRRWKKLALVKRYVIGPDRIKRINKLSAAIRKEWLEQRKAAR